MRILLLSLITVLSLTACREGEAKNGTAVSENTKPYKATTVDACINEKECVWSAFQKHITLSDYESVVFVKQRKQSAVIHKWNKPVKFGHIGKGSEHSLRVFGETLTAIQPYFPYDIVTGEKYNTLIVFSDDFEKDITEKYREDFKKLLNDDIVYRWYKKFGHEKATCLNLDLQESGSEVIEFNISFIKKNTKRTDHCIISTLYSVFGLGSALDGFEFSLLSEKEKSKFLELTELDLFLIMLLYQPDFKSGMSSKEAKKAFESAYPEALKILQEIKEP